MRASHAFRFGLFILFFSHTVTAQVGNNVPEYGTVSDLKNATRVYVHSDDYEAREMILKELSKDGELKVVGKPEEAEFFIGYGRAFFDTGYTAFGGVFGSIGVSSVSKSTAEVGEFYVLMRGDKLENGSYRPRIIWAKQNLKVFRGNAFFKSKHPAPKITREFMKLLSKTREK